MLELYHLLVACLFGNEKLSKTKLAKRRGFGLNEELFAQDLSLSALGLKLAYPIHQQFCTLFSGERKRRSLGLILDCLYYRELENLAKEMASVELLAKLTNQIQVNLVALSDEQTTDIDYSPISIGQFVDMFCRKYRRNAIKCSAANCFLETYIDSQALQESLCKKQIELFIVYGAQFCVFGSRNINSTLTALKSWLKNLHFDELAALWYQYAVKKVPVSEREALGLC
jgi:hypothetical protein